MSSEFYVVSVRHTRRTSAHVSFFRPNATGYAYPLSWAGRYSAEEIEAHLDYYNNGFDTIAVPCDVVHAIATAPAPGVIDNDAGPVVLNTRSTWHILLREPRWSWQKRPRPQYQPTVGVSAREEAAKERRERLEEANGLIKIISDYGRRFFYNQQRGSVARFCTNARGQIYFVDDYSGKAIYVAYKGRWQGFTHGGTLRNLVEALSYYIRTGHRLSIDWIGPERRRITDGNIWGYEPGEMARCREAALKTKAIRPLIQAS